MNCKKMIVGLGNKGDKYEKTRHNVGQIILDNIFGEAEWNKGGDVPAFYKRERIEGKEIEIIKPLTYMNDSGSAVSNAMKKHGLEEADLIVIHDDIDLPFGEIKISFNRGHGGHNGVKSIMNHIKTKNFTRIRFGVSPVSFFGNIKKPQGEERVVKFLLSNFSKREQGKIKDSSIKIKNIIDSLSVNGPLKTMSIFRGKSL